MIAMTRKHMAAILLISSFLFSVLLVLTFTFQDGFKLQQIGSVTSLLDIAGQSDHISLTSVILGYAFAIAFLLIQYKYLKHSWLFRVSLIITLLAFGVESMHLVQGVRGTFSGGHFRVGLFLTLLNTWIYFKLNGKQIQSHRTLTIYDDEKQLLDEQKPGE